MRLLILVFILIPATLRSQAPGIEWQNTIGGNEADGISIAEPTSDGGYILGGSSSSDISGDKTEANIESSPDFWLIKLDGNGNIQWQNTMGGNGSDGLVSLAQT